MLSLMSSYRNIYSHAKTVTTLAQCSHSVNINKYFYMHTDAHIYTYSTGWWVSCIHSVGEGGIEHTQFRKGPRGIVLNY